MKVSLKWLQTYFDVPLPSVEAIADAYTFHAFEIDEIKGDMLDVKVLPNRAADCLSHRGLARELSAILDFPLKFDPLHEPHQGLPLVAKGSPWCGLSVEIEDAKKCLRYMGAVVKGVRVGPSPEWLREALESVGQRSINNVVDATNYVMLNIGQPLHAFDAGKLKEKDGKYAILIRGAKESEKFTTLSNEEFVLKQGALLITDANTDSAIGIAGIKGGKEAEVTASTTDLIVESANFDGTSVRHTAQVLRLSTDASQRFQNRPSPELCAYGMHDVLALITNIAGGEVIGMVDEYPSHPEQNKSVSVSLEKINSVLGSNFLEAEVENAFKRLALPYIVVNDIFTVMPPFERTDLTISEDLVEEVGRIIGYDRIPATELPPLSGVPDQARYRGIERIKDQLVEQGFTEISTQSFANQGDIGLANPLDKKRPFLRTDLLSGMSQAAVNAQCLSARVLGPLQTVKIFEAGTVFGKDKERLSIVKSQWPVEQKAGTAVVITPQEMEFSEEELEQWGSSYIPKRYELSAYKPFSIYPFIVRDIAFWVPTGTDEGFTKSLIQEHAGELLVRLDQFDRFEKEGRVSLAFRLVFQSMERTLTDEEANSIMEKISAALRAAGYEVR